MFLALIPAEPPLRLAEDPQAVLDGIGEGEQATSLVRGIIELGHTLGLTIVAEGVEEASQCEALGRVIHP